MIIDIIFAVLMAIAVFKGYSRGVIVAALSFAGFFIGLIAAMQLSATAASYITAGTGSSGKWLPFLSFLLVFFIVAFLIRMVARLLQKSIEAIQLGWANRLSGILLYAIIFSIVYSVALYYVQKLHLLPQETLAASFVYPFLRDLAPSVLNGLGQVFPFVKNAVQVLQEFFREAGKHAPPARTTS